MSEFTEAYYLRTKNQNEVIELIKRANLKDYVFPEKNEWVTFVIDGEFTIVPENLIKCNQGVLVHLENSEDYGWKFEIFKKDNRAVYYQCCDTIDNPEALEMEDFENVKISSGYDVKSDSAVLEEVLQEIDKDDKFRKVINRCMEDAKNKAQESMVTAYEFAENMGFFFYDWISYHYIELDYERTGKLLYGDNPLILVE